MHAIRFSLLYLSVIYTAQAIAQAPDKLDFGPAATVPATTYLRLSVFDGGRAELALLDDKVPATKPAASTSKPAAMPAKLTGAEIESVPDGHRATFDFAKIGQSCLLLSGGGVADGVLHVRPANGQGSSVVRFPRRISPPFSITTKYDEWNEPRILFRPASGEPAVHVVHTQDLGWLVITDAPAGKGTKIEARLPLTDTNRKVLFQLPADYRAISPSIVEIIGKGPMLLRQIAFEGRIAPSWGIGLGADGQEVAVTSVSEGPAMTAGVQPGDHLLALDGRPVRDSNDAAVRMAKVKIGDEAIFTFRRNGQTAKVKTMAE